MFNLNMIDIMGYGIHKMTKSQYHRYFPLPDYTKSKKDEVVLEIYGNAIDENFSKLLIEHNDKINLTEVILLDKVQKKLPITEEQIKRAIPKATWLARLEKITKGKFFNILSKNFGPNFELILDGSHNEEGSKTIKSWIASGPKTTTYVIFGMLANRSCKKFLINLKDQINHLFAVEIEGEDSSRKPEEIVEITKIMGIKSSAATDLEDAINKVIKLHGSGDNLRIIVCGSLYLAGVFLRDNQKLITSLQDFIAPGLPCR